MGNGAQIVTGMKVEATARGGTRKTKSPSARLLGKSRNHNKTQAVAESGCRHLPCAPVAGSGGRRAGFRNRMRRGGGFVADDQKRQENT